MRDHITLAVAAAMMFATAIHESSKRFDADAVNIANSDVSALRIHVDSLTREVQELERDFQYLTGGP